MMGIIAGWVVAVAVTGFAIVVDRKHSKQYDGDNLQKQGHDGELEPHVGSVCRHPETNLVISLTV